MIWCTCPVRAPLLQEAERLFLFDELRRDICAELPRAEVILDGEIVAIDDEGRIDFWSLMRGQGHVHFAVFDILWLNGRDVRDLPLTQCKKRLAKLIPITRHIVNRAHRGGAGLRHNEGADSDEKEEGHAPTTQCGTRPRHPLPRPGGA